MAEQEEWEKIPTAEEYVRSQADDLEEMVDHIIHLTKVYQPGVNIVEDTLRRILYTVAEKAYSEASSRHVTREIRHNNVMFGNILKYALEAAALRPAEENDDE